ncbi:MAG TPA: hypothetical protein VGE63_02095 [Candidatus Paceibacterota bacterium]
MLNLIKRDRPVSSGRAPYALPVNDSEKKEMTARMFELIKKQFPLFFSEQYTVGGFAFRILKKPCSFDQLETFLQISTRLISEKNESQLLELVQLLKRENIITSRNTIYLISGKPPTKNFSYFDKNGLQVLFFGDTSNVGSYQIPSGSIIFLT